MVGTAIHRRRREAGVVSLGAITARLRVVLFWVHLSMGVSAGAVILLMSATGALLGFEKQAIALVDGTPTAQPPAGGRALPLDALLQRAGVVPAAVSVISLRREPTAPVHVRFAERNRRSEWLDPYTGGALPRGPGRAADAMQTLRRWHRWVGQGDSKGWGRAATGAANLLFVFLTCSGFFLWWPRRWTTAIVRSLAILDPRLSGKARDFNWHHALGLWSFVPLFVIALSGVFMSYAWPQRWVDLAVGAGAGGGPSSRAASPPPAEAPPAIALASLDRMLALATSKRPDWVTAVVAVPAGRDRTVTVALASGNTIRPDLKTTVTLDRGTGAVTEVADYADLSVSRRVRNWMRFLHTGELLGLGGQLVATLVSLAAVVLVATGLALSVRRLAHWRSQVGRASA